MTYPERAGIERIRRGRAGQPFAEEKGDAQPGVLLFSGSRFLTALAVVCMTMEEACTRLVKFSSNTMIESHEIQNI
jgi:hypothetical protein